MRARGESAVAAWPRAARVAVRVPLACLRMYRGASVQGSHDIFNRIHSCKSDHTHADIQHLLHTTPGMHTGTTHHHLPLKFLLTAFKSTSVISSRPFFFACSRACLHRASSMGSSASSSATTAP